MCGLPGISMAFCIFFDNVALRFGECHESGKKVAADLWSETAVAAPAAETWFAKLPLDYMLHNTFPCNGSLKQESSGPVYTSPLTSPRHHIMLIIQCARLDEICQAHWLRYGPLMTNHSVHRIMFSHLYQRKSVPKIVPHVSGHKT